MLLLRISFLHLDGETVAADLLAVNGATCWTDGEAAFHVGSDYIAEAVIHTARYIPVDDAHAGRG